MNMKKIVGGMNSTLIAMFLKFHDHKGKMKMEKDAD
jgi:hypothetical protein